MHNPETGLDCASAGAVRKRNSDLIMEAIAAADARGDKAGAICFVEYDWTFSVYRFRVGQAFTDFRGVRSWPTLKVCKADLAAAGCWLGKKTDSRTWPVCSEQNQAK